MNELDSVRITIKQLDLLTLQQLNTTTMQYVLRSRDRVIAANRE